MSEPVTQKFTPTERAAVLRRMESYNTFVSNIAEAHGHIGGQIEMLPDGSGYKFHKGGKDGSAEQQQPDA